VEFHISLARSPGCFKLHPSGTRCNVRLHCVPQALVCISVLLSTPRGRRVFGQELLWESRQRCPASDQPSSFTVSPLCPWPRLRGRAVMQAWPRRPFPLMSR